MDNFTKVITIAAAAVVIAVGSHYLWNANRAELVNKCKRDQVVQTMIKIGDGPETDNYVEALQLCIDRGYPL